MALQYILTHRAREMTTFVDIKVVEPGASVK